MNKNVRQKSKAYQEKKKRANSNYKKSNKGKKPSVKSVENITASCNFVDEEGKGLVKYGKKTITVPYLIKGEKALIEVKNQGKYHNTQVMSLITRSESRVDPKCKYFYKCGGCQLQHMSNDAQSKFKENTVKFLMKPFGRVDKIISMENPYDYRNKAHSTFCNSEDGHITSGFYKEYSHEITPIDRCIIQHPKADEIIESIRVLAKKFKIKAYNEDKEYGFLRHVLIRNGFKTDQVMVVLVVADKVFPSKSKFVKALTEKHPEIDTIVMNINSRSTSVVLGEDEKVLYGKGVIEDVLCDFRFQISAKSFYQINPVQTEKLYKKAIEFARLRGDEIVLDAYSGIGTISLIASKNAKEVIGVELNKDAVKNSIVNARINGVKNARFYQADAGDFMVEMAKQKQPIDVVFMDPPRAGSDEKFLSSVVELSPKQVIYISCNPVTQVRDLKYLTSRGYKVDKIQPVDLFPQTYHVETVVKLSRK